MSEFKYLNIKGMGDELLKKPLVKGELILQIEIAYQLKRIADELEKGLRSRGVK